MQRSRIQRIRARASGIILDRKPVPKRAPLITTNMQAMYQLVVTFVLYFAGSSILGYSKNDPVPQTELSTMVFNTFVWMQIFNEFNNRRLDNKLNIFEGVLRNLYFIVINGIMVAGQIMIIFVGGRTFQIKRITGTQWAICVVCALPCIIWAIFLRYIPDKYAAAVFVFTARIWMCVYRPVIELLRVIFLPIAQAWRTCLNEMNPVQDRARLESVIEESNTSDEERLISTSPRHVSPIPSGVVPQIVFTNIDV